MVIKEWKNVSCEPKSAFFGTTLIRISTKLCKDVLSRTTESPMCRILKTAQNFSETMANSSHGFVSVWQITLHAGG